MSDTWKKEVLESGEARVGLIKFRGGVSYTFALFIFIFLLILYYSLNKELKKAGSSLYQVLLSDNLKLLIIAGVIIFIMATALKSRTSDTTSVLLFSAIAGGLTFLGLYAQEIKKLTGNIDLNPFDDLISEEKTNPDLKIKVRDYIYERYADPTKSEVYYVGATTLNQIADQAGIDRCKRFLGQCYETYDYVGFVDTYEIVRIDRTSPPPAEVWNEIVVGEIYPLKAYIDGKKYVVWCSIDLIRTDLNVITWLKQSILGFDFDPDMDYPHLPRDRANKVKSYL